MAAAALAAAATAAAAAAAPAGITVTAEGYNGMNGGIAGGMELGFEVRDSESAAEAFTGKFGRRGHSAALRDKRQGQRWPEEQWRQRRQQCKWRQPCF